MQRINIVLSEIRTWTLNPKLIKKQTILYYYDLFEQNFQSWEVWNLWINELFTDTTNVVIWLDDFINKCLKDPIVQNYLNQYQGAITALLSLLYTFTTNSNANEREKLPSLWHNCVLPKSGWWNLVLVGTGWDQSPSNKVLCTAVVRYFDETECDILILVNEFLIQCTFYNYFDGHGLRTPRE